LLDRFTATPPAGAAATSDTIPVLLLPPVTAEGDTETAASVPRLAGGGLRVSVVLTELVELAVSVTLWVTLTVVEVTGKVAEV